jgi:hypothetical protein
VPVPERSLRQFRDDPDFQGIYSDVAKASTISSIQGIKERRQLRWRFSKNDDIRRTQLDKSYEICECRGVLRDVPKEDGQQPYLPL